MKTMAHGICLNPAYANSYISKLGQQIYSCELSGMWLGSDDEAYLLQLRGFRQTPKAVAEDSAPRARPLIQPGEAPSPIGYS